MFSGIVFFAIVSRMVPEPDISAFINEPSQSESQKKSKKETKSKGDTKKETPKELENVRSFFDPPFIHLHSHLFMQKRKYLLSVGIITALGIR